MELIIKPASIAWIIALSGLIGYEVFASLTGRATLSQAVWVIQRARYGPLLPLLVGILMGHFFFSGE